MGEKNRLMVVKVPYELQADPEARERYIQEHYPEAIGFQGLRVQIIDYAHMAIDPATC
jgi:hypothetical protein